MKIPVSGPRSHKPERCHLCNLSQPSVDRIFLYEMTHQQDPEWAASVERLLDLFAV